MNIKNSKKIGTSALKIVVLCLAVTLLTLSFYQNIFEVADMNSFNNWQNDSESLVIGRLIKSRQSGLTSDYGLLQRDLNWTTSNSFVTNTYVENFYIYTSQIGLQGFLFGVIDRISPLSSSGTLEALYLLNSLLLAILIAMIALWTNKEFGFLSGIFLIIGCIFSPWLTFGAKNLYWVIWTMLLPFVVTLYLHWLEQRGTKINQWIFAISAFIVIFIRAACGFEFITTFLISIELPVIFYALKNNWTKREYILRSTWIGLGGITAFLAAFCVNIWQRTMYFGSFETALENMQANVYKRTGIFEAEVAEVYLTSLEQPLLKVINTYLRNGTSLLLDYRMDGLIFLLLVLSVVLFVDKKYVPLINKDFNSLVSLAITIGISLIAPISWFVFGKGHSAIHTHINYITWYIPCVPLLLMLCGAVTGRAIKGFWDIYRHSWKRAAILLCAFVIFIWPIYKFYQAWNWKENTHQAEQIFSNATKVFDHESYEVYYYDNALYYKIDKDTCAFSKFFLHLVPKSTDDLPEQRIEHGFDNLDFSLANVRLQLPFWKPFYFARVNLPDYEIEEIMTGQYNDSGRIWVTDFIL